MQAGQASRPSFSSPQLSPDGPQSLFSTSGSLASRRAVEGEDAKPSRSKFISAKNLQEGRGEPTVRRAPRAGPAHSPRSLVTGAASGATRSRQKAGS